MQFRILLNINDRCREINSHYRKLNAFVITIAGTLCGEVESPDINGQEMSCVTGEHKPSESGLFRMQSGNIGYAISVRTMLLFWYCNSFSHIQYFYVVKSIITVQISKRDLFSGWNTIQIYRLLVLCFYLGRN